jgi:hypothetical protein
MAQLIVKRGPSAAATRKENKLQDWDDLLHSIHLQKIALNPSFYDDARVLHDQGICPCKCTCNLYLWEDRRR